MRMPNSLLNTQDETGLTLAHLQRFEERVTRINLGFIEAWLFPLFIGLVCLNFLDVLSTLAAMHLFPKFTELNQLVATLFKMQFNGFLLAMVVKYSPLIPMGYIAFLGGESNDTLQVKALKIGVFVALIGADVYYLGVTLNNIPQLIRALAAS